MSKVFDHLGISLDRLLPHPLYAPQSWICPLNPSEATFEQVKPMLVEAYQPAARAPQPVI